MQWDRVQKRNTVRITRWKGFAGAPIYPALFNLNTWNACVTRLTEVVSGGTTRSYTGSARCR